MIHSKPITLVLDLGSYRTLLGIAGEENPSLATYSYLTTDNTYRADDPYTKYSVFGKNNGVESQKPEDELESIFQNCNQFGQVDDYVYKKDTFETFVETALAKNLEMSGETLSILIAEDVACDSQLIEKQREDIAEFFFETL